MSIEDHNKQPRSADQIARDGGHKGARIIQRGRTGETAIEEFEKTHGNLNMPAYKRKKGQKPKTRETFSDN